MKTILFQGDSITDMFRSREDDGQLGIGYPTLVAGQLGMDCPNEFCFMNRGVSGDRVIDLLARVKCDFINLSPDILSILIGVNDVWHELGVHNGVDAVRYEQYYNILLDQVQEALPNTRIMILEPFLLKASATEAHWEEFRSQVELRASAAKRIAQSRNLTFVPLMQKFDEAAKLAPASYWLADGVHPTAMGHELIKREWIKAFQTLEQ